MKFTRSYAALTAAALLMTLMSSGCATDATASIPEATQEQTVDLANEMELDMTPLAAAPPVSTVLSPVASGTAVVKNQSAIIDYSNTKDGYVMIGWIGGGSARIKVQSTGPSGTTYTYNLNNTGSYETFPLSDGSGSYKITVLRNTSGTKYAIAQTLNTSVNLKDEFAPFIRPNQYVNYTGSTKAVGLAAQLTAGKSDVLTKVSSIYDYVIKNISYDKALAQSVQSGYLPNLDNVLARKKGICFDYAALMTAMLRSQNVATKLVVGYTGTVYHAWINVYSPEQGWIDGVISFDGKTWKLMDPTFASSGKSSDSIMKYIGNGKNYQAKYLY